MTTFVSVAIPYVNAEPHVGYAFELVVADLVARARRSLGEPVRFVGGTDDHSLKNVLAAEVAGEAVQPFVDRHAERFVELAARLGISIDDFVRTSHDERHRLAVERLWHACAAAGDLYEQDYTGWYCVGCEQYYEPTALVDRRCPEHDRPLERVTERNWFFRLSRHAATVAELIETGELVVEPEAYRNEVLAFLGGEVRDLSVSRSRERARGWGIAVPGDPDQVIYVWFDALVNYLSALDYGTDGERYTTWWRHADERIHVVGKGIVRFHAVYWPAFLVAAGEPLPTRIHVHPYLTTDGVKISKSAGGDTVLPRVPAQKRGGNRGRTLEGVLDEVGVDAFRWWAAKEVGTVADTDFRADRVTAVADDDLANGLGNAIHRVTALRRRLFGAVPVLDPHASPDVPSLAAAASAFARFERRQACAGISAAVAELNRDIERDEPWRHPRQELLDGYLRRLADIVDAAELVVPATAARARAHLDVAAPPPPSPVYPRRSRPPVA